MSINYLIVIKKEPIDFAKYVPIQFLGPCPKGK